MSVMRITLGGVFVASVLSVALACSDAIAPHGGPGIVVSVERGVIDPSCRTIAESPTFSGGLVHPKGSVECARIRSRLRVAVELTRDGAQATRIAWDCRTVSRCQNKLAGAVTDPGGDQHWCTVATGYVHDDLVAEATACEDDPTF